MLKICSAFVLILATGCACWTSKDPAVYGSAKCVAERNTVNCVTDSVKAELGRGEAIVTNLIASGTVDVASLLAALETAGISSGECILAVVANNVITTTTATPASMVFVANFNAYQVARNKAFKVAGL